MKRDKVRNKKRLTAEDFIRIWQASDSVAEVIQRTGSNHAAVNSRAYYYRKNGIRLKKMPNLHKKRLNVDVLNAIIVEIDAKE